MQAQLDNEKIAKLLESTLNPSLRKQAEDELNNVFELFT